MSREQTVKLKQEFSDLWVDFAKKHAEDMNLGDWLEVFGVLSSTVVMNSTCPPEEAEQLFDELSEFAYDVYQAQEKQFLTNIQ